MSRAGGGREPGRGACARRWVRGGRGACMRQALGPGTGGLRARACASGPGSGVQHSAAPPGWADRLAGCDWVVWVLEGGVGACWQDVLCVTHACPGGSDLGRRRGHKACGGNSSEAGALTCCVHAYGASCVQDHHNEGHCGRHAEHRLSAPASGGCLCRRPRTHPPTTASPRPGTAAGARTNFRLYFMAWQTGRVTPFSASVCWPGSLAWRDVRASQLRTRCGRCQRAGCLHSPVSSQR